MDDNLSKRLDTFGGDNGLSLPETNNLKVRLLKFWTLEDEAFPFLGFGLRFF